MTPSDTALALIRKSEVDIELEGFYYDVGKGATIRCSALDADALAACFAHVIDIAGKRERTPSLGTSLRGGPPHLPKTFAAPKGMSFWMQINLAEVDPHDIDDILPDTGMLWVFQHPTQTVAPVFPPRCPRSRPTGGRAVARLTGSARGTAARMSCCPVFGQLSGACAAGRRRGSARMRGPAPSPASPTSWPTRSPAA